MPFSPLRACSYPGCQTLVKAGRCAEHQVTTGWERDAMRQRLYGRRWRKIRAAHLAANPWCVRCLEDGVYSPANDVDHKVDHKGDVDLFYSGELQSLCHKHHSEKTAKENTLGGVKKIERGGRTALGVRDTKKVPNVGNSRFNGKSRAELGGAAGTPRVELDGAAENTWLAARAGENLAPAKSAGESLRSGRAGEKFQKFPSETLGGGEVRDA